MRYNKTEAKFKNHYIRKRFFRQFAINDNDVSAEESNRKCRKVLNSNISAYRKGHSTTTVLQAIRDDTVKAMKRSEVTMMILTDFSKAFDTICFRKLITKTSKLGFSRNFLIWTLNYVMHGKQFVQRSMKRAQRLKT